MANLKLDAYHMQELVRHLVSRENSIPRFYRDQRGLVTIGVGILVDAKTDVDARKVGEKFARDNHRLFRGAVNTNNVFADWQRVRNGGRARLRLTPQGVRTLLKGKLGLFIDALYRNRPFVKDVAPQIHMALVDARFNPAGVPLYGRGGNIGRMWSALDPADPKFDPRDAMKYFSRAWQGRGGEVAHRYARRHALRVDMFRRGVEEMEHSLRSPTKAIGVRRHPAYPALNAEIIGVFKTQADANAEAANETVMAMRKGGKWECCIRKKCRAIRVYINNSTIVGIYKSQEDATHDFVKSVSIKRLQKEAMQYRLKRRVAI